MTKAILNLQELPKRSNESALDVHVQAALTRARERHSQSMRTLSTTKEEVASPRQSLTKVLTMV